MKNWLRFGIIMMGVSLYAACSDVKFDVKPSSECEDYNDNFGDGTCTITPTGFQEFNYSVRMGQVDILFVTDNSGSMFAEQQEMANRFPSFLDSIRGIDYQIAITTTDIPSSDNSQQTAANGNGTLWDGKFIAFPNGQKVLRNANDSNSVHNSNITYFEQTVQRPESANCDNSNFQNCPSSDERAIYAVNRALDRSENSSFFRGNGHLAIVILSDEDERSTGGESASSRTNNLKGKALESYDLPATLVQKAATAMGATKTMSVHSIIIQPGDTGCKNSQDAQGNQWVFGQYGDIYRELSSPNSALIEAGKAGRANSILMAGTNGSICSNNYTNELGEISDLLNEVPLQIPCTPNELDVTTTPEIPGLTYQLDSNNRIVFSQDVIGTVVDVRYTCPRG
ncbi:MAG: hypothetical protein HRT45_03410 [Bdellovibrionales bacterium]|nr:hypothetical protein [Bdellovibrionales bacterium]